jgi:hypothetical protein
MKSVLLTITAFIVLTGCSSPLPFGSSPRINSFAARKLMKYAGQTIVLVGRYRDPGKGERFLDCGYVRLPITDYSLYHQTNGELVPMVRDGEKIEVRAMLDYYPGSRVPVQDAPPVQDYGRKIETIDGVAYQVYPPRYSIREVVLLKE